MDGQRTQLSGQIQTRMMHNRVDVDGSRFALIFTWRSTPLICIGSDDNPPAPVAGNSVSATDLRYNRWPYEHGRFRLLYSELPGRVVCSTSLYVETQWYDKSLPKPARSHWNPKAPTAQSRRSDFFTHIDHWGSKRAHKSLGCQPFYEPALP